MKLRIGKPAQPSLQIIAAMDANAAIGFANTLLYPNKPDFDRFRALTEGTLLLMGRKTYESLPCVLPGRDHWVLSSCHGQVKHPPRRNASGNVALWSDLDDCLEAATYRCMQKQIDTISVIGGADLYRQLMPRADILHLTVIRNRWAEDADAYFPVEHLTDFRPMTGPTVNHQGLQMEFLSGTRAKRRTSCTTIVGRGLLNTARQSLQNCRP